MKKLLKSTLIGVVLSLLLALPVFAYTYQASLTVTSSNTSTSYSMLPVSANVNTLYMASNGFIHSDAMDTRVQNLGGTTYPWMVTDSAVYTALAVSANSQTNLLFTAGNANATSMSIITGYGGNITVVDAPNLEFGQNFTLNLAGYFNMSTNGTLWSKPNAVSVNISGSKITASLNSTNNVSSSNLSPDANATMQQWPSVVGNSSAWQTQLTNDGNTTYIATGNMTGAGANMTSLFSVGNISTSFNSTTTTTINWVAVTFVGRYTAAEFSTTLYEATAVNVSGTLYYGVNNGVSVSFASYTTNYTTSPKTGSAWNISEVNNLEAGVFATIDNVWGVGQCTQVLVRVGVTYQAAPVSLSSPVLASASNLTLSANGNNVTLTVDGNSNTTALYWFKVPDNANNITIATNYTMPYITNVGLAVNGTQVLQYAPNTMIIGTNLPNRASSSYNGTFNWGAMPASINVTLGSLSSTAQPSVATLTVAPLTDVMHDVPVSDWYVAPQVSGKLLTNPLRPIVLILTSTGGMNEQTAWRWFGLGFVILVLAGTAKVLRGHLIIAGIATGVAIGMMVVWTVFPLWALLFAVAAVVAGVLAQNEMGTNRGY